MSGFIAQLHPNNNSKPMLFVPGAFTGAWIWQDRFAPYFYAQGYHTYAMTFAGHGQPRWLKARVRLADYVQQLADSVSTIIQQHQQPPVIISHSLGGLVTLKYLAEHNATVADKDKIPTAVCLSPIPHDGILPSALALLKKSPLSAGKFASLIIEPRVRHLGSPPIGIYSQQSDPQQQQHITRQLNAESPLALLATLGRKHVNLQRITTPCYFIAGGEDYIVRPEDVQRTAQALQAPCKTFPTMGHTFQAEQNWETIAHQILAWLPDS